MIIGICYCGLLWQLFLGPCVWSFDHLPRCCPRSEHEWLQLFQFIAVYCCLLGLFGFIVVYWVLFSDDCDDILTTSSPHPHHILTNFAEPQGPGLALELERDLAADRVPPGAVAVAPGGGQSH